MRSLLEFASFVNEQVTFHRNMEGKFAKIDPKRAAKHRTTAQTFAELLEAITAKGNVLEQVTLQAAKPSKLFLSLEEVDGLPEELIRELSFSEGDKTEYAILRIIEECGGAASLDRILFDLYKKTNEVMKRATLNSRLYRMIQKGQLYSVPSKKGVYSLRELTETEAENLV